VKYLASGRRGGFVLYWAVVFLVIAVVAAILGFGNIVSGATTIAIVLFVIFLIMAVCSFVFGWTRRRR
jgi:uncharacterized membrane protein YtjA (UPF0391 family)